MNLTYGELLKSQLMVGQIDPWRRTDDGNPIYALLVPTQIALDECNAFRKRVNPDSEELTRAQMLKHLKDDDVFVFRNVDEFVNLKNNLKDSKKQKIVVDFLKPKSKRTISPERKITLQKQAEKMRQFA